MQITITSDVDHITSNDFPDDLTLDSFFAFCQTEFPHLGSDLSQIGMLCNGQTITELSKSLKDHGLKDGDTVFVTRRPKRSAPPAGASGGGGSAIPIDFSQIRIPSAGLSGGSTGMGLGVGVGEGVAGSSQAGARPPAPRSPGGLLREQLGNLDAIQSDPDRIREMFLGNPAALARLREVNPPLAEAFESGDREKFAKILRDQTERQRQMEKMRIRALNDPFDMEAQKFIEQQIHQENIEQVLEAALEHTPESFGTVIMLYIRCRVNGHDIKAFVDSGAQTTIMSAGCAERCGITRLIDKRFTGIAKGVGTQRIIGRVHLAQLQIEDAFLPCSFTILEDQTMDMLLGLDMLKRHQCILDLKRGVLVIGTTGTETPFLPEAELPLHARLNGLENPDRVGSPPRDGKSPAPAPGREPSEEDVKRLTAMGFDREMVIGALRDAGGDYNAAVSSLLARSLSGPAPGPSGKQ